MPENIQASSLRREPQVTAIPNADLQYVNIVTDGILVKKFQKDPRAMVQYLTKKKRGGERGKETRKKNPF